MLLNPLLLKSYQIIAIGDLILTRMNCTLQFAIFLQQLLVKFLLFNIFLQNKFAFGVESGFFGQNAHFNKLD